MYSWGNPRLCYSTEYIQQSVEPNTCSFLMKFINDSNFCLNTRAVNVWRCIAPWLDNSKDVISCHFGLHVIVIKKKPSHPYSRMKVIVSYIYCSIWRGLRTYDDGRMKALPTLVMSMLLMIASRKWMYCFTRSFCWLCRKNCSHLLVTFTYMLTMNWLHSSRHRIMTLSWPPRIIIRMKIHRAHFLVFWLL